MNRLLLIPLVCLVMAVPGGEALAIHKCGGHCVKCPSCNKGCCKLDVSEGKVKKTYWTIETEDICVPRFVFPWQNCGLKKHASCGCGKRSCSGCTGGSSSCGNSGCSGGCSSCKRPNHNGGRVITVRVLKKHSYECPVCLYKWSAESDGRGCSNGCSGNCSCASNGNEKASDAGEPEPKDAPEPPEAEPIESEDNPQQAPAEPALGDEPLVEEIPTEAPIEEAPGVAPQSYNRRVTVQPEPRFSIVDPFTRRLGGRK